MSSIIIPSTVRPSIAVMSRFRNGLYPEASSTTFLQEEANRIAAYCGKQWSFGVPIGSVPAATSATRQRWRAFIHTSSHHAYINVRFTAMPANNASSPISYVTFTVPGGAIAAVARMDYGAETTSDTADAIAVGQGRTVSVTGTASVDLSPDTDYEVNAYDLDYARTMSVSIFEHELPHDTANGYAQSGVVATQEILDVHRQTMTGVLRTAWKRNAAPLITFASNLDASSPTSTIITTANLIDGVTGAPTAATAGFTLNLANRSTIRRASQIPCVMKVYGKQATAGSGHCYLTDSSGTDIADVALNSTTEQWFSTTFNLPTTNGKYDLRFVSSFADQIIY